MVILNKRSMAAGIHCKHCKAVLKGIKTHAKHQLTFHKSKLSLSDVIKYTALLNNKNIKKTKTKNKKKKNGPDAITGPIISTPM
jgi:hypothetical protein